MGQLAASKAAMAAARCSQRMGGMESGTFALCGLSGSLGMVQFITQIAAQAAPQLASSQRGGRGPR